MKNVTSSLGSARPSDCESSSSSSSTSTYLFYDSDIENISEKEKEKEEEVEESLADDSPLYEMVPRDRKISSTFGAQRIVPTYRIQRQHIT
jgi:hypothetical protein